jgi:lipopolysaccharide export system protein LptA
MTRRRADRRGALLQLLLLAFLVLPAGARALSTDREQPVYISADRVEVDEKAGVSHYTGDVQMRQGSLHVDADTVTVYKKGEELSKIVADGKPTHFRQKPDDGGAEIHGRALHLEYHADSALLYLTHDAHVQQAKDEFTGEHVVYDSENSTVHANGGDDGRVHAVIHPKPKDKKK